ncbi:MAG TPA: DUF3772 domain-containing protein [Caulobacteraceae bacterium]
MRLAFLVVIASLAAFSARTQTMVSLGDPTAAQEVSQAQARLQAVFPGARLRDLSDADLQSRVAALPPIKASLTSALADLTPRLQDIDTRLAQLGPAPGPGQPAEPAQTAQNRQALLHAHQSLDGEIRLARLLLLEADQTARQLSQQRHDNFSARLWTRNRSILDPGLWSELGTSIPGDVDRLSDLFGGEARQWTGAVARSGRPALIAVFALLGLGLLWPARVVLGRFGVRRAMAGTATRLRRSSLALWLVMVATLSPLAGGFAIRIGLRAAGAATEDFDALIGVAIGALTFAWSLDGLGRALLSPRRPSWRLAPISDEAVARVAPYPALVGAAAGVAALVRGLNAAIGASLPTSVASDCVTVVIELVAVGAALLALARARRAAFAAPEPGKPETEPRLAWILTALGAWLALGVALMAIFAGYLALGSFLVRETVWVAAVLAAVFLAIRFTDDYFPWLLSDEAAAGRAARLAIGVSKSAMDQIGVLASGVFRVILLALGLAAILAPFGAGLGDVAPHLSGAQFNLRIGQTIISPATVLGSAGLFLVGLLVTRAARGWLEVRYLPKTDMDLGVRNSVAVATSYAGVVIALVLAFAYLGLSFSQIALFASALSVGIGFGLQAVISNFVSGLILLAERPIKVGDWVAIGDLEGDVKAINIRATEIEMADRSRLIVPNSDLVSKMVRNVTHNGALGRVRIVLRVDDTADPKEVREVVLARLRDHDDVLAEPPPGVYLTDVRDGALEVTALGYLASARYAFRVKSELLFRIVPDLRARGIALASPATLVNVALSGPADVPGARGHGP